VSFSNLCESRLPLNRKERYYTGTVFPAIVCTEDFNHFGKFLKLLNQELKRQSPPSQIDLEAESFEVSTNGVNIQFFTEYNLAQSIFTKKAKARFPEPPETNETPDIMILIDAPVPLLIAIEAKMYSAVSESYLRAQMERQAGVILGPLKNMWPGLRVVHAALLPQPMKTQFCKFPHPVITWDGVYFAYKDVASAHYFVEVLWTAISQYEDLKSRDTGFTTIGHNAEGHMSGQEILDSFGKATFQFQTMGRKDGLSGQKLLTDITEGHWRKQIYEVNTSEDSDRIGSNWFKIDKFVKLVKEL
jgi:hypothetical protein